MADHRPNKGWLVFFGVLLFLALAYLGYGRWRHSQLVEALHDADPVVRMNAVRKAGKAGHEALLIEALHDDDPDIRYVAAWDLEGHGEKKVRDGRYTPKPTSPTSGRREGHYSPHDSFDKG